MILPWSMTAEPRFQNQGEEFRAKAGKVAKDTLTARSAPYNRTAIHAGRSDFDPCLASCSASCSGFTVICPIDFAP